MVMRHPQCGEHSGEPSMKPRCISSLPLKILGCVSGLLLTGCSSLDNVRVPHIFGANEVPPAVVAQPRLVESMPAEEAQQGTWPRLGDVPVKPVNFTPAPVILVTKEQMDTDRQAAKEEKRDYDASGVAATAGQLPPAGAQP